MSFVRSPAGSPFRNKHFTVLWVAMLAFEFSNLLMIQLPGFLTSLGLTEGLIGAMYSVSGVVAIIVRPWMGRMIDLRSRRTMLLTAAVANATLLLVLATPDSATPLLWVAFVGWRVAQIGLYSVMLTAASDVLRPERRTQGLALFGLSGLLALTMGGAVGDAVRSLVGFPGLIYVAAALAGSSLLVKLAIPASAFHQEHSAPRRSFWFAIAQRDLLPMWLVAFTFAIGMNAMFTFIRTYVDTVQVGSLALFFLAYGGVASAVRIVGSGRYDLFDPRQLLIGSLLIYAVGLGTLAGAGTVSAFVAAAVLCGFGHGVLFPVITSQVVVRARQSERGSALSAFMALFDLGLTVMAPITGRIIDVAGYTWGFGTVAAAVVIGAIAYGIWEKSPASVASAAASG